jgi:hypothetical protein
VSLSDIQQAVGRATRRNPYDGPDARGTAVLMVRINMAKYQACSTDAERSAALRQHMRDAACGNFAAVADFLLALKAEDEAFLYVQRERPRGNRQQQPSEPQQQPEQQDTSEEVAAAAAAAAAADAAEQPEYQPEAEQPRRPRRQVQRASAAARSNTGSSRPRAGIAAGLLRRFQFDFSLAPGFEQIFALAGAQADAAGATEGSAFLEQLLLSTPGLRQSAMLNLLHKFVQQHKRLPYTAERFEGEPLGEWCNNRKAQYRRGDLDDQLAEELDAVPGWNWGQQKPQAPKAQLTEQQWLQLLREFQQEHGKIPHLRETQNGFKVGAWCSSCRTRQVRGTLSQQLQQQLLDVPGWWWSTPGGRLSFDDKLQRLHAFVDEQHRQPQVGERVYGDFHLGAWVATQRAAFSKGALSQEKAAALLKVPHWRWAVSGMQLWKVAHSNKCSYASFGAVIITCQV